MSQGQGLPPYVKPAVLAFKDAELRFLDSLPPGKKRTLGDDNFEVEKWHIRSYGDVAFTIAGLKPCALLAHGAADWFAKELVEAALLPLMKPEGVLAKAGFELHEIKHRFRTSNPVHPGFQGGWVLVNTKHPLYSLVKDTFLTAHSGPIPEDQIGEALGYPTLMNDGTISYIDATESEEKGVCCVPVAEYFCSRRGDIAEVLHHFGAYRAVWEQLGRRLSLDTVGHPMLAAYIDRVQAQARRGRA